ncbi:MAG: hypothetical protein K8R68_09815 [Bacteroidales bacterium]|nr:hypothetical protein [Bacteroidales bacterium]
MNERIYGFSNQTSLEITEHKELFLINYLNNTIEKLFPDLTTKKIHNSNPFKKSGWYYLDIDNQGKPEFIIFDRINEKFTIYQAGLSNPVSITFPYFGTHIYNVSTCNFREQSSDLFIQAGQDALFYKYSKNELYYLKYPAYFRCLSSDIVFPLPFVKTSKKVNTQQQS